MLYTVAIVTVVVILLVYFTLATYGYIQIIHNYFNCEPYSYVASYRYTTQHTIVLYNHLCNYIQLQSEATCIGHRPQPIMLNFFTFEQCSKQSPIMLNNYYALNYCNYMPLFMNKFIIVNDYIHCYS